MILLSCELWILNLTVGFSRKWAILVPTRLFLALTWLLGLESLSSEGIWGHDLSKANWGLTGLEFDTYVFLSFGHYPRIWFFLSVLYKKVKTLTILLTLQLKNETFYCLFRISADPQCLKINQNVSFEFFNFSIFRQYCLHRIAMFGNIVWPHSSGFQKIVKLTLVRFS